MSVKTLFIFVVAAFSASGCCSSFQTQASQDLRYLLRLKQDYIEYAKGLSGPEEKKIEAFIQAKGIPEDDFAIKNLLLSK